MSVGSPQPIEGADSDTYTPVMDDDGKYLRATATSYTDPQGSGQPAVSAASANAVEIDDTNRAPTFPDQDMEAEGDQTDQKREIAENTDAGEDIGVEDGVAQPVVATDPNEDTLTYTLGGADAASFDIVDTSGQLQTKAPLDREDKDTYMVTVTATDPSGLSATVNVTIKVTDVDEAPTIMRGGLAISGRMSADYAEDRTDAVETYNASGPDAAMATWDLSGDDAGSFSIDASGVLTFTSQPDYEAMASADGDNVYMVTVEADDGTYTDTHDVTVTVTDVEDTPVEPESLLDRYDTNGSGRIDKDELADGVFDYNIEQTLSKDDLADLIFSYEIG